MNGYRRCGTCIKWSTTQLLKNNNNNAIRSNMAANRDYHIK